MDSIIFKDPFKQLPCCKSSSHILSTEERAAQGDPTDSQQQECIQNQQHNNSDPHAIGPVIALSTLFIRSHRLFTALIRQQNPPQHLQTATSTSAFTATMTLEMTTLQMAAWPLCKTSFPSLKMMNISQIMTVLPL